MDISADIILRGDVWVDTIERTKTYIAEYYGVYILSVAIGIYYDKVFTTLDAIMSEFGK